MTKLTVSALFTLSSGLPATGLTLGEVVFYLTAVNRSTGAATAIWDGSEVATVEVTNTGQYARIYDGDLSGNDYFAAVQYTGAADVGDPWVFGSVSPAELLPKGSVEWAYRVTDDGSGDGVEGVLVQISTDAAKDNVIWVGYTNVDGYAKSIYGDNPWLDPGTYYFWAFHSSYNFDNPDTEEVA